MKLFILQNGCYDSFDSNEVYGVFSSLELAEEARFKMFGKKEPHTETGNISEIIMNEEIKIIQ